MDRRTTLKLLVGFAVALVLVYLLGAVIGWDETIERLRAADLYWVGVACASTLLCLLAWTKTWQVVLGAAGVTVPFRKLVVTFYAAMFANYITPMGQAGGEPFIAYILSRDTEANYEESLASVVIADLLRMLPFFNVGLLGLGYLLLQSQLPEGTEQFAALLLGLAIVLPVGIVLAWHYRDALQRVVVRLFAPLARRTDRITVDGVRN
ncbi:MAG: lysylphosphatidylglycerol synthase transmembrane domain-containing protein, partial [Natronomonas sp.]